MSVTTEDRNDRVLRLLDSQRRVLERIASGAPLEDVLDTLARLVEGQAREMRCTVLIADAGQARLRFAAAPSFPDDFTESMEPFLVIAPDAAPCGEAAYHKKPVYVRDAATDPRGDKFRDIALRNGVRAMWSTPILADDNRVFGTFALFHGAPGLPSPEHIQLIEMATQMARVAIEARESEEKIQALSRQNEDRLRLVIDTIPTMAWSVRPDGVVDFLNKRWVDYSGLNLERYVQDPTGPIHREDIPRVVQRWSAAMAAGESSEDEMRLRRADGEYRWFLVRTVPLRDEQGNIVKWYGTSTDIEDRKRAEDALRESEEKFRQLAENVREVFWMTTPDMDELLYVSPAYANVWGLSLESLRQHPRSFIDAIHPEDRGRVVPILEGQRQQGFEVEYRIVRPDGSVRWIRDRGFPVKDASGKVYRIAGVAEEITERKRADDAARESQRLLQQVLAKLPVGVVVMDRAGDILLLNAAAKGIWGADPITSGKERLARSQGFLHDSGRKILPDEWASVRAMSGGETSLDQLIDIETYDGKKKTITNSAAPIRNIEDAIVGAVVVNEDVTVRVLADRELREYARRLQHLSRRLVELQESERKELARELHDRVGQSLTALKINVDILQTALASQGNAKILARIADSAALLESTMDTIENVMSELRPPMLDDHGLTAALDWYARNFSKRTGIGVAVRAGEPALRPALQVEVALFRIAQEALNNVAKHARAHRVEIALDHTNGEYVMSVRDDGIGFDSGPDAADKPKSGLGMVTMRERAQAVGGRLEVQALPGRGTQLSVRVPS